MIELAQRDPDLSGKIDQRYREGAKGNHEGDGNAALVLNVKERACEADEQRAREIIFGLRNLLNNRADRPALRTTASKCEYQILEKAFQRTSWQVFSMHS